MTNKGIVTKVEGDLLTVIFERHEACGDCHACMHGSTDCKKHTVQLRGKAEVGDEVVVEMDDSHVMSASAAAYLIPFAGMIVGLTLGWQLSGSLDGMARELTAAAAAVLGTAAAYGVMRLLDARLAKGRWEQRIVAVRKPEERA